MTFSHALKLWGRQRFFHNRAKIEEMEKRFSRSESLSGRSFQERAVTLRPVALRWDEFVKYEKLLIFGAQKFSPKPEIRHRVLFNVSQLNGKAAANGQCHTRQYSTTSKEEVSLLRWPYVLQVLIQPNR